MRYKSYFIRSFSLLCAFALASCEADKEAIKRLEGDNFRQRKENQQMAEQLRKANLDLEVEKASRQRADEEVKAVRAKLESLRQELEKTREAYDNYQRDFQLQSRVRAVGQELAELTTTDGKTYRNVTIRAVLSDTMVIGHTAGSARLFLSSLGDKWMRRFDVRAEAPVCFLDEDTLKAACDEAFKARSRK